MERRETERQRAKRRAAEHKALVALVRDFLALHGATPDELDPGTAWSVQTALGALRVHVIDDWIACRWDDVEAAKRVFPHASHLSRLNPYSGKWNFSEGIDRKAADTFEVFCKALTPHLSPAP